MWSRATIRLKLNFTSEHTPHPHQAEAFDAWQSNQYRGVVVLPTGSGKSLLALMGIAEVGRSTLVVAPTIDLMNQWYDLLKDAFSCDIGILGGGYHELEDLTVTTYDSAYMHMDRYGNRFGFLVFDEVHHLPGESLFSRCGTFYCALSPGAYSHARTSRWSPSYAARSRGSNCL